MSFSKGIKNKIRNYFYNKELNKISRHKQVVNFDEADSIGVLFDGSTIDSWTLSNKFIKDLEEKGKKVVAMSYIRQNKPCTYLVEKINLGIFRKKDFSWSLKRKLNALQDFERRNFDILIDLTSPDLVYTKIVSGFSRAKYKVGVYNDENVGYFDLMIQMPEPFELQELTKHILYYLKLIKKTVSNVE